MSDELIVKCPICRRWGTLDYDEHLGWIVGHGNSHHNVKDDESIEVKMNSRLVTLIRYVGGDSPLIKYIAKMFPPHHCYVEVFGGGAPVLLNKSPSPVEVYNDIDGDLVNLFMVVKNRYDEFINELKWLLYSRQLYYEFLLKLKTEKDPVKRASMYYYLIHASFNGNVYRTGFSVSKSKNHAKSFFNHYRNLETIHDRLKNVVIEQLDFRELIRRYDGDKTFFYLDPPHLYYATEKDPGYYRYTFSDSDYMDLLHLLTRVKGKWLLKQTYIPFIVKWAEENGFNYTILNFTVYANKLKKENRERREKKKVVFIANYNLPSRHD